MNIIIDSVKTYSPTRAQRVKNAKWRGKKNSVTITKTVGGLKKTMKKKGHMKYRSSFFFQHVQDRWCLAFYTWGDKIKGNTLNTV